MTVIFLSYKCSSKGLSVACYQLLHHHLPPSGGRLSAPAFSNTNKPSAKSRELVFYRRMR